jgi:hypothetical protein
MTKLPSWFSDKQLEYAQALRTRLDKAKVGRGQNTGKPLLEFTGLVTAIEEGNLTHIETERTLAIASLNKGADIMGQAATDGGQSAAAFSSMAEKFREVVDKDSFLKAIANYDEMMFLMMREAVNSMRLADMIKKGLDEA